MKLQNIFKEFSAKNAKKTSLPAIFVTKLNDSLRQHKFNITGCFFTGTSFKVLNTKESFLSVNSLNLT